MDSPSFQSILFDKPVSENEVDAHDIPAFFRDLNLDQILQSITKGREEYGLDHFFCYPLKDVEAIGYRQDALRDLEGGGLRKYIDSFAESMRAIRQHLSQADKLQYQYQKIGWFLDAVEIYCDAIMSLYDGLSRTNLNSQGFRSFRDYLGTYVSSEGFKSLLGETKRLKKKLSGIEYRIHIQGLRVTVGKYGGEPDYSAEVEKTFRKFQEGAIEEYAMRGRPRFESPEMNQVEERVLDMVAKLYPDVFSELVDYRGRHGDFLDQSIRRFDREVQFYIAYLQMIETMRQTGLEFCYPQVNDRSKSIRADQTFDLALANMLIREHSKVVTNDFYLDDPERVFVVSGPNQGGKTTFARTFGQLHYLARLGYPVPGKEARLYLSDRLFTHFAREEHIESLQGKLQDELVRMKDILQLATANSIIIVNEGFASTTVNDALFLGREILQRIIERGCLCVYVTFLDELSTLGEATVSMVSTVVPENPTQRTFKVVRKPADGRAYALAIAEKYGLTHQSVKRRLAR